MKKLIFALLLSFTFLGLCNADLAGFTIDGYNAEFNLTKKGVLEVVENIDVNFTEYRHGLYRTIPYIYSNYLKTPIKKVKVPLNKFSKDTQGNNLVIKIGDPKKTIIGEKFYSIRYNVKGSVREFSGYQELYRNMLGTDRNTPVNNFKFSLTLPTNLDLNDNDIWVYIGEYGSTNTIKAVKSGNIITISEPLNLGAHEGVTLAVKLPANYVPTKKYFSLHGWFAYHLKDVIITIWSIILGIIGFYTIRQRKKAYKSWTDFKKKKEKLMQTHGKRIRDVIHFSFPEGYTAAEVAAIYNRKSNFESISAFLFSRIEDGYVSLEGRSQRFLFFKSSDYEFKVNTTNPKFKFDESREKGNYLHLENPEEQFWNLCFVKGDINDLSSFSIEESYLLKKIADEVFYTVHNKLIPQRNDFRTISFTIADKYKIIDKKLKGKHFTNTQTNLFCLISMVCCGIGALLFLLKSSYNMEGGLFLFLLLFVFASVILYTIMKCVIENFIILKAKSGLKNIGEDEKYLSEEGIDAIEQTLGFRKFLLKVDDTKLKTLLTEDPTYFEKVLPYAIALGVGDHWIKKCMKYLSEIKDADRYDAISSKIDFSESISDEVYKIDHPHDGGGSGDGWGSDWGGGSSGSSGGGSSGGGGGGGGGGSW